MNWEKIFTGDKNSYKSMQKGKQANKQWSKDLNRYLEKNISRPTNRKRCTFISRDIQNKTTRYY